MKLETDFPKKLNALRSELETLYKKSVPFAVAKGLNEAAFQGRKEWQKKAGEEFTLRNTWTTRRMFVDKAKASPRLESIEARLGSDQEYMAKQEGGFIKAKKGKHGVPVPTATAAGQGKTAKRTKPVRRSNRMGNIRLTDRVSGSRQRKNTVAAITAIKSGTRVGFFDLRSRQGLFRVKGSVKKWRLEMLHDLTEPAIKTKAHPTLGPSAAKVNQRLPAIMVSELEAQIAKQKAFKRGRV